MPRYVLFKDHPNTHQEIYYRASPDKERTVVRTPEEAKPFVSAADAYRDGGAHGLDTWKVGQR